MRYISDPTIGYSGVQVEAFKLNQIYYARSQDKDVELLFRVRSLLNQVGYVLAVCVPLACGSDWSNVRWQFVSGESPWGGDRSNLLLAGSVKRVRIVELPLYMGMPYRSRAFMRYFT